MNFHRDEDKERHGPAAGEAVARGKKRKSCGAQQAKGDAGMNGIQMPQAAAAEAKGNTDKEKIFPEKKDTTKEMDKAPHLFNAKNRKFLRI